MDEIDQDFAAHEQRRRRRFRLVVTCCLVAVLGTIFIPWLFVRTRTISQLVATIISWTSCLLLVGAWQALAIKISDPSDAPEPTDLSRRSHVRSLLVVAACILAAVVSLGGVFFLMGIIERDGLLATVGLDVFLGLILGRALLRRAVLSGARMPVDR